MDGGNAAASMPMLISVIERAKRIANTAADLGDQITQQAERVIGAEPPPPPTQTVPGAMLSAKPEGGPLLDQIDLVLGIIERNLSRVANGANRLGDLG